MTLREVREYIFHYTPWDRKYPIKSMRVSIVATSRKEAELIAIASCYKFFEQDTTVDVSEGLVGYEKVD